MDSVRQRRRHLWVLPFLIALCLMIALGGQLTTAYAEEAISAAESGIEPIDEGDLFPTETPIVEDPIYTTIGEETYIEDPLDEIVDDDLPEPTIPDEESTGSITISKWNCPVEVLEIANPEYGLSCTTPVDGVGFNLYSEVDWLASATTGETSGGVASFELLDAGSYQIVEDVPAGYAIAAVYCWANDSLWEMPIDSANQTSIEINPVQHVACDWYNVEIPNDGLDLTIEKWTCPAGYDLGVAENDPAVDCWLTDGIDFTLYGFDSNLGTATSGSTAPGELRFEALNNGDYVVTETVPATTAQSWVECYLGIEDPAPDVYDLKPGEDLNLTLDDESAFCRWYNIEDDELGRIRIKKWTCPVDYVFDAEGADPLTDCELTDGVSFVLHYNGSESDPHVTGEAGSGQVEFDPLLPGDYDILEEFPAGTDYAVVYCAPEDVGLDGLVYSQVQPGELYELTLEAGQTIECAWFNMSDDNPGWLTIEKYWCEEGEALSVETCDRDEGGAEFNVELASGEAGPIYVVTNVSGEVTTELAPGSYAIDEVDTDWCGIKSDVLDDNGYAVVYEDYESTVVIFNCYPDDEVTVTPVVTKTPVVVTDLPNTGAGSLTGGGAATSTLAIALMLLLGVSALIGGLLKRPSQPRPVRLPIIVGRPDRR